MNDTLLHQRQKAITDFRQQLNRLALINTSARLTLQIPLQIPTTKFLNNVVVIGTFHHIYERNNVVRV